MRSTVKRMESKRFIALPVSEDLNAASFRSEAHRQSLAVAESARASGDQAFIDAVSDWGEE